MRAKPSKLFLIVEFAVLFVVAPVIVFTDAIRFPKIPLLAVGFLYCLFSLRLQGVTDWRGIWNGKRRPGATRRTLAFTGVGCVVLLILAVWLVPDGMFAFPRRKPVFWVIVMVLYPFLSAYPQEFMYRTFFFDRYRPLFKTSMALIVASSAAFAFLHVIYDNVLAVALSLVGGVVFSLHYQRDRSLFLVGLEHAIYGCAIFTFGLGRFFYER